MTRFCTLPGQDPVRLASLTGHVIIIGENPREVPDIFAAEARGAGCLSEDELNALTKRLLGGERGQTEPNTPNGGYVAPESFLPSESKPMADDNDGFPSPPGTPSADRDQADKILEAVIEILNTGNPSDLIANGAPKVEVLSGKLGFEVSVADRDNAYKAAKG